MTRENYGDQGTHLTDTAVKKMQEERGEKKFQDISPMTVAARREPSPLLLLFHFNSSAVHLGRRGFILMSNSLK